MKRGLRYFSAKKKQTLKFSLYFVQGSSWEQHDSYCVKLKAVAHSKCLPPN